MLQTSAFCLKYTNIPYLRLHLAVQLPPRRPAKKVMAITAYLSFLAVTLIPAIGVVLMIPPEDRDWPTALLEFFWLFLLGPAIQLLGVAAFIVQAWRVRRGSNDVLSVQGLVVQAVVFFLVKISFLFRYRIPPEELDEHFIVNLRSWYWRFGWATINNVVFALAQGMLAWLVLRRKGNDTGERTALLSA
jgi:hypothetical protein